MGSIEASVKRKRGRPRKGEEVNPKKVKEVKIVKEKKKRIMSPEHKKNLLEGLRKAREAKREQGITIGRKKREVVDLKEKPTMIITGKEETAFDFFNKIRATFRGKHDYISSPKIIRKIVKKAVWKHPELIKEILNEYVVLKVKKRG